MCVKMLWNLSDVDLVNNKLYRLWPKRFLWIVLGRNTAEFSATSTWVVCRIQDSSEHNVLYVPWGVDNLCMCAACFQLIATVCTESSFYQFWADLQLCN